MVRKFPVDAMPFCYINAIKDLENIDKFYVSPHGEAHKLPVLGEIAGAGRERDRGHIEAGASKNAWKEALSVIKSTVCVERERDVRGSFTYPKTVFLECGLRRMQGETVAVSGGYRCVAYFNVPG